MPRRTWDCPILNWPEPGPILVTAPQEQDAPSPKPFSDVVHDEDPSPVGDPSRHPHGAIGAVRSGATHLGTGFLVTPRLVLTAAHVFRGLSKMQISLLNLRFGGAAQPVAAVDGRVFDPGAAFEGSAGDLAVLLLAHPPAGLRPISLLAGDRPRIGHLVEVSGYPGKGTTQLFHRGPVVALDGPFLDYRLDTERGHSGAPVLSHEPGSTGAAIAVHVLGSGHNPQVAANRGILLTPQHVQWIGSLPQ